MKNADFPVLEMMENYIYRGIMPTAQQLAEAEKVMDGQRQRRLSHADAVELVEDMMHALVRGLKAMTNPTDEQIKTAISRLARLVADQLAPKS